VLINSNFELILELIQRPRRDDPFGGGLVLALFDVLVARCSMGLCAPPLSKLSLDRQCVLELTLAL